MPKRQKIFSRGTPAPNTRTAVPPTVDADAGATASTVEEAMYTNPSSDTSHTSPLPLTDTITGPPSRAGDAHSTPYPAALLVSGPIVPKRQADTTLVSTVLRAILTIVPPLWGPCRGVIPTIRASSTYS